MQIMGGNSDNKPKIEITFSETFPDRLRAEILSKKTKWLNAIELGCRSYQDIRSLKFTENEPGAFSTDMNVKGTVKVRFSNPERKDGDALSVAGSISSTLTFRLMYECVPSNIVDGVFGQDL